MISRGLIPVIVGLILCSGPKAAGMPKAGDIAKAARVAKAAGTAGPGISLTVTSTNVSYDYPGFYADVLTLTNSYGLFYNGSVNITATGGTGPYTFTLTSPYEFQYTGSFTGLAPGTYNFIVTDANGLTANTTVTITSVYPLPSVALSNIIYPTSCTSGNGSFTLTGSGGTPPYTYSIDGGATFTTNTIFTNLSGGDYPLLLVKDANGLLGMTGFNSSFFSGNYFSGPCPIAILFGVEGSATACSGSTGSASVSSQGGIPPVEYSSDGINYYPGIKSYYSPTLNTLDSQYSYTFNNLPAGILHVYAKDSAGNVVEAAIPILKICDFSVSCVSMQADCRQSDGSVTATAVNGTPPYTYSIDGVTFQTSSVFPGLASGNYNITGKDANGLIGMAAATVTNNCPTVTLTETDEACGIKNGTITATGASGTPPYGFSIDGINYQAGNVFTGLSAAGYTVTIKDAGGFTGTAFITVNNNCLQLTLAATGSTCGYKNGSITATGANGTAPYQYSADNTNFQAGNIFDSLAAGNYTITMIDDAGLKATAQVTITASPGPQISVAGSPASCLNTNGSITISATGGTAPLQFSINGGVSSQAGNVFANLDSGQYIAWAIDGNSCQVSDTILLSALPTPVISLGDDTTICPGDSLLLAAPDSSGYQYQWQDGSQGIGYTVKTPGTYSVKVINQYLCAASAAIDIRYRSLPIFSIGGDTALCTGQVFIPQPVFQPPSSAYGYLWNNGSTNAQDFVIAAPGLYWLQVSDSGCTKSDSITVTYKPNPVLNFGDDTTLCAGQTLLLDATNPNAVYQWQDGSTQPSFTVSRAGTYSVKVVENGCDATEIVVVDYTTKALVDLGSDTILCVSAQLTLDAAYPQSTYLWQDGSTGPLYRVSQAGTYTVDITNLCGDTAYSVIVAYQNCACGFHVPTAFTPNNDGINDVFLPKNECPFSDYEVKVFDRWGKMIFVSRNAATGWDGTFNSQPQPSGTYVWELVYKDGPTGNTVLENGTLVLMR